MTFAFWLSAVDSWLNDVGFPAVVKLAGRCLRPPDTDFNGIGPPAPGNGF